MGDNFARLSDSMLMLMKSPDHLDQIQSLLAPQLKPLRGHSELSRRSAERGEKLTKRPGQQAPFLLIDEGGILCFEDCANRARFLYSTQSICQLIVILLDDCCL